MRSFVERVYAAVLFVYPPDLRRAHGVSMRQCARDALAARGISAALPLFVDLLLSVPHEWALVLKGLRVTSSVNGLVKDVVHAGRLLARSPGFTAAAVLTLALGIGANAAIFSLADATLLRPLKVAGPSELYVVKFSSAYPDFQSYRTLDTLFSGVIATSSAQMNVVADGRAELADAREARFVSGDYFDVLGVPPAAGRVIGPTDDTPNGPLVVVLGYRWWHARFGGDPGVVGKSIRVNHVPATIVGVAAKDFHGTSLYESAKLFVPLSHAPRVRTGFFSSPALLTTRNMVWLNVIVRLRPGVTPQQGAAAIEGVYRQAQPLKPGARAEPFELQPLRTRALGGDNAARLTNFVALLGAVVVLTLLIGCANLANLLLSRAAARRREIGVRMAIGAGPGRIARQLLIESLVLSAIGGAAGLYVAAMATRLLGRFQLPGGIEVSALGLELSGPMLLFTAGVSCATGVIFGIAPAWRAARTDVLATLRDDSRATTARSSLRSTLVAIQVALSAVLLIGAGLFLRSLVRSLDVPLGFQTDGIAAASVNLGAARYDAPRGRAFYADALIKVRQLPGVTAAAWTNMIPSVGGRMFSTTIDGYRPAPGEDVQFYYSSVGPDYFKTVGTRLLRGRTFTEADGPGAPKVGIINEAAARKYWSGRDPLAGRLTWGDSAPLQIVGIAENTVVDVSEAEVPYIYLPFAQDEQGATLSTAHLLVRTAADARGLLGPIGEQVRSLDRDAPVFDVDTLAWRVRHLVMPQQMGTTLFGVFSLLAVTIAAIGIYGVASYVAALRTKELGIRIALGADRARIRRLVLRQGSVPVAVGLAAGLVLTAIASQAATAFLREVPPRDPLTYATVSVLLAAIALVATWIPARRAAQLDPIRALRQE